MALNLGLRRSWARLSELRRDQPRAQVKTVRKIAAALKVEPSEIVVGIAEEADDEA